MPSPRSPYVIEPESSRTSTTSTGVPTVTLVVVFEVEASADSKDAADLSLDEKVAALLISKRKLALLTTIDRVYLLQIEQKKYRPTLNAIFLLAQAFGISPGYMVTLIDRECQRLVNAPPASEE